MKIGMLAPVAWRTPPRNYGPWEQVCSNLTEGLTAKGADVTLFATGDSQTAAELRSICSKGYEEDEHVDAKVAEYMHISFMMEQAAEFDIIHNHFDFPPLSYSRLIRPPIVTTIHGFSSPCIVPVYRRYNDICHYVSISYSDRHRQLDYLANIYNGLDPDDFTCRNEEGEYLLFFGRIHPDKGTREAIDTARLAGMKLIIAGYIQDHNYWREQVEPMIDHKQVVYVGNAGPRERDRLLGGAYALLHLINFAEPFGLSVAESMLCGTPVVAFNRGSMQELIKHGETGFLVNNIEEAAVALKNVPGLARERCRKWAEAEFSIEKMTEAYMRVYEKILGSSSKRVDC